MRRPLLWILGGWILGELLAGWLGLIEVPASSYYAAEQTELALPLLEQGKALLRESIRRLSADAEEDGLFAALLLGDKRSLTDDAYGLLKNGGIAHIVAISGLHLTLIANAVQWILKKLRLSKRAAALGADLILLGYVLMIGGSVSAWRAFVMFSVQTGAVFFGRTYDAPSALGLAGLLILLRDPYYVYNAAFQLSFAAVYALSIVAPVLERWLHVSKNRVLKAVLASAAVQLVTFPLIAYHFYTLPVYGLLLNLLAVPPVGAALASLAAAVLAALVYLPGGVFLCGLAHYIFRGILWLCAAAERLPGARFVTGRPYGWQLALYCALLAAALVWMKKKTGREQAEPAKARAEDSLSARDVLRHIRRQLHRLSDRRGRRLAVRVLEVSGEKTQHAFYMRLRRAAFLCALFALALVLRRPARTQTALTMLDVGQGDCFVVEFAGGGAVLVDAGSSSAQDVGNKVIVPYLQQQRITQVYALFLSHPDADHINGTEALLKERTILVERVAASRISADSEAYAALAQTAGENGADWLWLETGDVLRVKELSFSVWSGGIKDGNTNDESMLLLMEGGGFSALFTGDMEAEAEAAIADWPDVDVLKVPHHGSETSCGEALLQGTTPQLALISAGARNPYGHPHAQTLARLAAAGAQVHCTAQEGTVTVLLK